jgi:NAD(P)-dependent dehydrogenase (short-subunit alcohol dehydrogenase family)
MSGARIALVTGANRGLGQEMALQLGQRGMTVLLGVRNAESGEVAAAKMRQKGVDVQVINIDMSDPAVIAAAVKMIDAKYGNLDVLVNNAAILNDIGVSPSETDEAVLRENLDVNFIGPFLLTRDLVPLLRKSEAGRVLNLATQVGSFANICDPESPLKDDICASYQVSKIALNAMTALFAKELAPDGIKVNSVCPGWVMTDMGHENLPDYGDAVKPLTPHEAVEQMLWLVDTADSIPTGSFYSQGEAVGW